MEESNGFRKQGDFDMNSNLVAVFGDFVGGYYVGDVVGGEAFYSLFVSGFYPFGSDCFSPAFEDDVVGVEAEGVGFSVDYAKAYVEGKGSVVYYPIGCYDANVVMVFPFDSPYFYEDVSGSDFVPYSAPEVFYDEVGYAVKYGDYVDEGEDMHAKF